MEESRLTSTLHNITQTDTIVAMAGGVLALVLGILMMSIGQKTELCAFGYPPYGTYTQHSIYQTLQHNTTP